jgi:hypothetical protein
MASSISSALNQLLAGSFSEAGKAAQAFHVPVARPPVIGQAKPTLDTADRESARQGQSQLLQGQEQQRRQSLRDLAKPEVQLLPSDETELFAVAGEGDFAASVVPSSDVSDQANAIRRQALSEASRDHIPESLQLRARAAVADLYARNTNIVFNATPAYSEAA